MEIFVEKDYQAMSERAAQILCDLVAQKPDCILGLATGSTPLRMYELLAEKCQKGEVSFKKVRSFNLDEYLGLDSLNEQSYKYFMQKNLFSKTDFDIKNTFFPVDFGPDYGRYDNKIKETGGIDLQILGIGRNGHIGFNEPGSSFDSITREVKLSEETIKDNSRFFPAPGGSRARGGPAWGIGALGGENLVPKTAVTMGIFTIMQARQIILLASGSNKQEAVFKALKGQVDQSVPASVLQHHPNAIIIVDKDAGLRI